MVRSNEPVSSDHTFCPSAKPVIRASSFEVACSCPLHSMEESAKYGVCCAQRPSHTPHAPSTLVNASTENTRSAARLKRAAAALASA